MHKLHDLIFIALIICSTKCIVNSHDFKKCPNTTDKLAVSAVSLSPDPIVPGTNVVVKLSGGPTAVIVSGGKATLSLKLFGVVIFTEDFDICTQFGIKCPVAVGEKWTAQITQAIPKQAPAGAPITTIIDIFDKAGKKLSCLEMEVKVGPSQSFRGSLKIQQANSAATT